MSAKNGDTNEEAAKPKNGAERSELLQETKEQDTKDDFQVLEDEVLEDVRDDTPFRELLTFFSTQRYTASSKDPLVLDAMTRCLNLLQKDYSCALIDNSRSRLSEYYPMRIPFPESEKGVNGAIYENSLDIDGLEELILKARRARCRERFPVPVIFYKGKPICRSSTLSLYLEIFARKAMDYMSLSELIAPKEEQRLDELDELYAIDPNSSNLTSLNSSSQPPATVSELQKADVMLLQRLNIGTIVDLMVENKKHKAGIAFSSSEKAEREDGNTLYSDNFKIASMPYPGCEFFEQFHKHDYNAEGLCFNWAQTMCDSPLSVPTEPSIEGLNINWADYKSWDVVTMTQKYMKYILKYLQETDKGILIHCISGWDRTPLFIALIRLSLWADGLVHESLNEHEMLYFTIAYDWMLFGHQLKTRLYYKEEILLFCFYFLKFIVSTEYSIAPPKPAKRRTDKNTESRSHSTERNEEGLAASKSSVSLAESSSFTSLKGIAEELNSASNATIMHRGGSNESLDANFVDPLFETHSPEKKKWSPHTSPERVTSSPDVGNSPRRLGDYSDMEQHENVERTPPMAIPNAGTGSKSSSESGSGSLSNSGWMYVSNTGSLRSSDPQSDVDFPLQDNLDTSNSSIGQSRKAKLTAIRSLFYKHYYKSVANVNYKSNQGILISILSSLKEMAAGFTENPESESQ